jgi:hypothetical protein
VSCLHGTSDNGVYVSTWCSAGDGVPGVTEQDRTILLKTLENEVAGNQGRRRPGRNHKISATPLWRPKNRRIAGNLLGPGQGVFGQGPDRRSLLAQYQRSRHRVPFGPPSGNFPENGAREPSLSRATPLVLRASRRELSRKEPNSGKFRTAPDKDSSAQLRHNCPSARGFTQMAPHGSLSGTGPTSGRGSRPGDEPRDVR